MKNIIKIELIKIKGYVPFWIIGGVSIGLFLILSIMMGVIKMNVNVGGGVQEVGLERFMSFPNIWKTVTWLASWFNLFIAVLIIILIGNEYRFRTFKQHIIEGVTRNQLLFGKYFMSFAIALVFSFAVFFVVLIFGLINTKELTSELFFQNSHRILLYFLQSIAYMSFAIMITTLLRNTMLSFFVFIAYFIFEWILRVILLVFKLQAVNDYFPMKIITNLTPEPFGFSAAFKTNPTVTSPVLSISFLIFYIAIFIVISFWVINKRDMK